MLFRPHIWIKNVLAIDKDFVEKNGFKGLVLDLDNTLSMHGNPAAENGIFEWLDSMRALGIKMVVVSNNTKARVAPLAAELGLEFFSFGCKPLPFGINKAVKLMGLPKKEVAVVGDQIFTDVLGGKFSGIRTVLVEPFHLEDKIGFRFKRKLESVFFKRDYSKLERK